MFPQQVRDGVIIMLLCQIRSFSHTHAQISLLADKFIIFNVLEYCHWDWFDQTKEDEEVQQSSLTKNRPLTLHERLRMMLRGGSEQGTGDDGVIRGLMNLIDYEGLVDDDDDDDQESDFDSQSEGVDDYFENGKDGDEEKSEYEDEEF
jgi:hypothetical protein